MRTKVESEICKRQINPKLRHHCHYTDKYRDATNTICFLKSAILKEIGGIFYNGSIHDYHFIIKELAEKVWIKIYLFRIKYWKIHNLCSFYRKKFKIIGKEAESITKFTSKLKVKAN